MARTGTKSAKPQGPALPSLGKVLFPTDLSPESLAALPYAASLAARFGGFVQVLHLVAEDETAMHKSHGYTTPEAVRAGVLAASKQRLDEVLPTLDLPKIDLRTAVDVVASIPDAIAGQAAAAKCEVIVMATHARTGLAHFFGGSVTEATLRSTNLPVLAVRVS